jgi:[NiFe] hydrogenase diaphorase moiety large subunit
MNDTATRTVRDICRDYGNDRHRMMDIALEVQRRYGQVSDAALEEIAVCTETHRVEVESTVSFYAFLSRRPQGQVIIRLCDDIIDRHQNAGAVETAFCDALGIAVGQTTADGRVSLERTACIGMCDQAPAALVNDVVLTYLSTDKARRVVEELKGHMDPSRLVGTLGDGNNGHDLVHAMVNNNIRRAGPVVLAPMESGRALEQALAMRPAEVIRSLKTARLRGRGGAGFPTGMKWEFTRATADPERVVICNADEGEPGTFKDRVILTEQPDLLFEGMAIGAYAIGAQTGILYLRAEYAYLRAYLEDVLRRRRDAGFLGLSICGCEGFDFDIRIQMGAGAYICGEETALISSCEGSRGDPKNRPPFPAQQGYLGHPTTVNNVETFCCVARILEKGPGFFAQLGSKGSAGTKLLSVAGDCKSPGVYEAPFGVSLRQVLDWAGAEDAAAVQVGGPSGMMVGPEEYDRKICYDDLATGGALTVFGPQRDLLEVVDAFMGFFVDESCGYCTPCRVGNALLLQAVQKVRAGKAEAVDLEYIEGLGHTVKTASRCGLGQTSPNPVLSTLANFTPLYRDRLVQSDEGRRPDFDLETAVGEAAAIVESQGIRPDGDHANDER